MVELFENRSKKEQSICTCCGKSLNEERWNPEWDQQHCEDHFYKSLTCNCGEKNWIKMDCHGSGHMINREIPIIESTIKKVVED
jgi:hypothetical protein